MSAYTCSKCGEAGLGMYGHYDSETDGFTCGKKKAEPRPPVASIDDSELGALRAEVARLKKELGEERNHYKSLQQLAGEQVAALREDVKTWKDKEAARYCEYAEAIGDRNALRKENEARRWECLEWQQKHDTLLMGLHK